MKLSGCLSDAEVPRDGREDPDLIKGHNCLVLPAGRTRSLSYAESLIPQPIEGCEGLILPTDSTRSLS